MPALNSISIDKLARLVGTPRAPVLIDVRAPADGQTTTIPGAIRRSAATCREWAPDLAGQAVIVVCKAGHSLSQGVAAWLRSCGAAAEALDGGMQGWTEAGLPTVDLGKLPPPDDRGRSLWVTRARPKVDRIACPWLIRRFIDPRAIFLFVPPNEVQAVAAGMGGAAFDIEGPGVMWSHRGELCTFDVMVQEFGLAGFGALSRLAVIVRGADTGRPEIAPEAPGLLAASLGLSRMYTDDLEQLEAGMALYDAFYRWCRDASEETHSWASHQPSKSPRTLANDPRR